MYVYVCIHLCIYVSIHTYFVMLSYYTIVLNRLYIAVSDYGKLEYIMVTGSPKDRIRSMSSAIPAPQAINAKEGSGIRVLGLGFRL